MIQPCKPRPPPPQRVWFPPPLLWVGVGPAPPCGWGMCVGVGCGAPASGWTQPIWGGVTRPEAGIIYYNHAKYRKINLWAYGRGGES